MKQKLALLCAAALVLSACAPGSGQASASAQTSSSGATDGVYENSRILTVQQAQDAPYLSNQLDSIRMLRDQYGAADCRYINLAGTVAEELLDETLGTLRLANASYDSGGANALPSGAACTIEWSVPDDVTRVTATDSSGAVVLDLERQPDGSVQTVSIDVDLTAEECESLAYCARTMIQNRYAASGSRAPFSVQPTPAAASGDQISDEEAEQMIRSVCAAVSRMQEWQRNSGYVLADLREPEQGIVMEYQRGGIGDASYSLYLPSLSFDTPQDYQKTLESVLLPTASQTDFFSPFCAWGDRLWVMANQPGIGGSSGIYPEEIEIVSKEPERITADIRQAYNASGVSAVPLYTTRYEFAVRNGNWVLDSEASALDEASYNAAMEAWNAWFNEHYAQFYLQNGGMDADLGALWQSLGAGQGSWTGTEEGAWNEKATLVSPGFTFSVRDGRYAVSLYSTLGSGATTFFADSALTDGSGNYVVTLGSVAGEMQEERRYGETQRPQLWIETGAEGDGLIEIAGRRFSELDGWMYEYRFEPDA